MHGPAPRGRDRARAARQRRGLHENITLEELRAEARQRVALGFRLDAFPHQVVGAKLSLTHAEHRAHAAVFSARRVDPAYELRRELQRVEPMLGCAFHVAVGKHVLPRRL